ncbi:alpha/beta fold hydrolase [Diaminobutyricibacter sp. McL0618]|uniref:alpha/beta fold hydrolase n=1 Tax=Leifsonia sp. McL0618 TaxID=3415677 RepID=UPI003CF11FB0
MTCEILTLGSVPADLSTPVRAVFLHGYACSSEDWLGVVDELGPGRYLLVDFPGHGSAEAMRSVGFLSLVEQTASLLDLLPGPTTLAGHSMGGMVAIAVAASHRVVISALVLADAFPDLATIVEVFGGAEDDADPFGYGSVIDRQTPSDVQARVRASMTKGVRTAGTELHAELMALDLRDSLQDIDVPTLVMVGDRRGIPPMSATEARVSLGFDALPNATVQLVSSHHFIMLERPQEVARQTEKFLLDQEITVKGKK